MEESWEDRLAELRNHGFLGREAEQRAFLSLFESAPHRLLCFSGPARMGKSSLLARLVQLARDRDWGVTFIDGRKWSGGALPETLHEPGARPRVLFVDDFDQLFSLTDRFRDHEFPRLHSSVRVVLSLRDRLGSVWLGDAGWRALIQHRTLQPFSLQQSVEFLLSFGFSPAEATKLHVMCRGNPGDLEEAALDAIYADGPRRPSPLNAIRSRAGQRVRRLIVVPNEADFRQAVEQALHDFRHGARLSESPLLNWMEFTGSKTDRVAALRRCIELEADQLGATGRDALERDLIMETFVRRAAKQHAAAAQLDMGFSTYRRHLDHAVARLSQALFARTFSRP